MSGFLLDWGGTIFVGVWLALLWRMFRHSRKNDPVLRTLCARFFFGSLVLALIAELTLFNWPCYLARTDESTVYNTKDFEIQEDGAESLMGAGIKLRRLDRRITSLRIDLSFYEKNFQRIEIVYKDEESTRRYRTSVYSFSPRSRYIAILPHGKVSEIGIYSDDVTQIENVTLNPGIPMKLFLLRIALLGLLLFMGCLWFNRETREKLRFFLFDYPLDETHKGQKKLYWGMVFSFVLLLLLITLTSWMAIKESTTEVAARQGMMHIYPMMADALLKGQLHLDLEVAPELLESARPYDPAERGVKGIEEYADFSYYEGKYYSYFGIVPVLLLFAPFKLLAGQAFPTSFGVFVFSAAASIALALLWREMARKFMPHMPFFLYCLGGLSLMMVSYIILLCRHPVAYELALASSLMFLAFGLFLFIRAFADERKFHLRFFLASLCFALAVGCRPTAIFMSILTLLFAVYGIEYLRKNGGMPFRFSTTRFVLICLVLPYATVALPLMGYNYARFGSITDFGAFHQLTLANMKALPLANPIGKLLSILSAFQTYFFSPFDFSAHFPFAALKYDFAHTQRYDATLPVYMFNGTAIGLINLPLLWFLFAIRRVGALLRTNDMILFWLLLLLPGIGLFHILFAALYAGVLVRYNVDFLWLFTLAALICAYFTYRIHTDNAPLKKAILGIFYASCVASITLCLFSTLAVFGGAYLVYPPIYYYLKSFFIL
jgi:hypothetical protein